MHNSIQSLLNVPHVSAHRQAIKLNEPCAADFGGDDAERALRQLLYPGNCVASRDTGTGGRVGLPVQKHANLHARCSTAMGVIAEAGPPCRTQDGEWMEDASRVGIERRLRGGCLALA